MTPDEFIDAATQLIQAGRDEEAVSLWEKEGQSLLPLLTPDERRELFAIFALVDPWVVMAVGNQDSVRTLAQPSGA